MGVENLPFDRAIERLLDLGLLDVQQRDLHSPPRYIAHSLVPSFARTQLAGQPGREANARERWLRWHLELAAKVGFRWDELERLRLLDEEHESIYAALNWAFAQNRYSETICLVEGVRYYYNGRGLWDERLNINLLRAEAARKLGDASNEVLALAHHVEIRGKQVLLAEAESYLRQVEAAAEDKELSDDARFELHPTLALYDQARGELASAARR